MSKQSIKMDEFIASMKKTKLFSGFSDSECADIYRASKPVIRTVEKNTIIIQEGDDAEALGIIILGRLSGIKFYQDGSAHLVYLLEQNETFGAEAVFSGKRTSPLSIVAGEHSVIATFPYRSLFRNNYRHSLEIRTRLFENIGNILANENIKQMYKLEILSEKSLRKRIMLFLQIISGKQKSNVFSIGMNQQQFSQYLCVNRSSLSTELNLMKQEQLIDWKGCTYFLNNKN